MTDCCTCGHAETAHRLGTRQGAKIRTRCTAMNPAGHCPCPEYTPTSSTDVNDARGGDTKTAGPGSPRPAQPLIHAEPAVQPAQAPLRRSGPRCGYEGKAALGVADLRLRQALTELARDVDDEARIVGLVIAGEAVTMLDALAQRAETASTRRKRLAAAEARLGRKLAAANTKLGRPPASPYRGRTDDE